jgi:hypothetical protein
MTGAPDGGRPYYGPARIAGGMLLIGIAVLLLFIDAISRDYAVDSIVLGLVLGTGGILLGVEAFIRRFPGD